MYLILKTDSKKYYEHRGKYFSTWNINKLSDSEIKERIKNWQLYLSDHTKEKEANVTRLFPIYDVKRFQVIPYNMSVFEYLTLTKNEPAENALKSAFIEDKDGYLFLNCKPFDKNSHLTEKNINIINDVIRKLELELLRLTGKDCIRIKFCI